MKRSEKLVVGGAIIALLALIVGCFWAGFKLAIWDSVKKMWPDPWFKVTLLDLYVGFALVGVFIGYRERSVAKTTGIMAATAGLGNIVALLYVIIELTRSGSARRFLEPKRHDWKLF